MNVKPYDRRRIVKSAVSSAAFLAAAKLSPVGLLAQESDYPEVAIIATDHSFEMEGTTTSSYNRVTLDNQGTEDHHAILFRVNDDASMEDFQSALMSGDLGAVFAVSSAYGGPNVGPGASSSVIVYLDPGMYMAVCVVPDAAGIPHVAHGMVAPLEVTDGDSGLDAPEATQEVSLIDMAFLGLPESVEAGDHVWRVSNDGAQLHEIVVLQLADGLDVNDVLGLLTGEPTEAVADLQEPPFAAIGGTAPMSPESVNYLDISLEPGTHVAICFIPDPEHDMPHFLMGMIQQFEVV